MSKLLKRKGADPLQMERFYMAVVQAVLLYGSESWTITLRDMEAPEHFHKKAIRYMAGEHIQNDGLGEWQYPYHWKLYRLRGFKPINFYIQKRRGTLRQYFEMEKAELLENVIPIGPPVRSPNKVL